MGWKTGCLIVIMACAACGDAAGDQAFPSDTLAIEQVPEGPIVAGSDTLVVNELVINTGDVTPGELLQFAKTLIGVPYRYGSTNPENGFDCSGFITYVFNHFHIQVPRSSIQFTNVGETVDIDAARPGDLILFTGTNPEERFVGHMGIITQNQQGRLSFIHSTSGKAYGVTVTELNEYYLGRFVRIARIFP